MISISGQCYFPSHHSFQLLRCLPIVGLSVLTCLHDMDFCVCISLARDLLLRACYMESTRAAETSTKKVTDRDLLTLGQHLGRCL